MLRRLARPKSGGFYDIETQFLSQIPIPDATEEQKKQIGELAKELQDFHTSRRDKMLLTEKRLQSPQTEADRAAALRGNAETSRQIHKKLFT